MEDSADKLLAERRRKLDAVRAHGVDPFGARFAVDGAVAEVRAAFAEGRALRTAGRVTAHRDFGKSHFLDLSDLTGRIQIYLNAKNLTPAQAELFALLDIGDFVGVEGEGFTTKTGEPTVRVREFQILGKALRPLPDKWHGLADVEARYSQRYLDLVANARSREIFLTRSKVLRAIRDFFHARGFLEVETPMMQPVAGGAAARPFVTHHNALGTQFYLRIALELYLKRLLVGGFPKVFEIGRNFRNEGLSRRHNPEFTMLEAYWAFADFEQMAELVEELICYLAQTILGTLQITHNRRAETEVAIRRAVRRFEGEFERIFRETMKVKKVEVFESWFGETVQGLPDELRGLLKALDTQPAHLVATKALDLVKRGMVDVAFAKEEIRNQPESEERIVIRDIEPWHKLLKEVANDFSASKEALEKLTQEKIINLARPWRRARYHDLIESVAPGWFALSPAERVTHARERLDLEIRDRMEEHEVTQQVFEKLVEEKTFDPLFVTHLPKELVPLAKQNAADPALVDVFELIINGQEIAPGYSELNDPDVQRARLLAQAGEETQSVDEDFLLALEHGMPSAGGIGIGIDRLLMLLTGAESIRDIILFPHLRPAAPGSSKH